MTTFGPSYDDKLDGWRLVQQHIRIKNLMLDGQWRTLNEIGSCLAYPEASVSAQLRHLRKPAFGAYNVEKRRRAGHRGLWEYRIAPREPAQYALFDDAPVAMRGH